MAERWPAFRALCGAVHADVTAPSAPPFLNWYAAVSRASTAVPVG